MRIIASVSTIQSVLELWLYFDTKYIKIGNKFMKKNVTKLQHVKIL